MLSYVSFCGCIPPGEAPTQQPRNTSGRAIESAPAGSAFRFDEAGQVISLDTRMAPPRRRRFDIGLGSITLETLRVADNRLVFRYTPEIEGGYTIYECTVPISPVPVEVRIAPDGSPGPTSFDLTRCKVIRQGNVHLEQKAGEQPGN